MRSTIAVVLAAALVTGACSTTTGGSGTPASPIAAASISGSTSASISGSTSASTSAAPVTTASVPLPSVAPQQLTLNPCTLVTKHDADKIAGVNLLKAIRAAESCTFPTPTSGAVGQFEIYVGDGAKKAYDIDHTELHHVFKTEAGVADEAHLENGAIFFRKGTTWVELHVVRLDGVNIGPALAAEARVVAGRLP